MLENNRNLKIELECESQINSTKHSTNSRCNICDKTFLSICSLQIHLKYSHKTPKENGCSACYKTFMLDNDLERHIKIIHENYTAYKCES